MSRQPRLAAVALLAGVLALAACGDDDGGSVRNLDGSGAGSGSGVATGTAPDGGSEPASGSAAGGESSVAKCVTVGDTASADTTVNVALSEWEVVADPTEVGAGRVHFAIENQGAEVHEMVVVAATAVGDLPVDERGVLDEGQLDPGQLVGEVEGFPSQSTCDGTFDLEPADYLLLCNIVEEEDDGTVESHLAEGMITAFRVTS